MSDFDLRILTMNETDQPHDLLGWSYLIGAALVTAGMFVTLRLVG